MRIILISLLLVGCSILDDKEDNTATMKSVIDETGSICDCTYGAQKTKYSKDSAIKNILK